MHPTAHLPAPALSTDADGHVSSLDFGDVYFSRASGAAETRHVFLAGNGLPERFAGRGVFTIGELGFGTGLNFFVAHDAFLAATGEGQHLHVISVEKFPLTRQQFLELHPQAHWYPLRLPGWHRIELERCTLTLGFGDAAALYEGLEGASVDAWFLDGFAPAKNPDMWSDALFAAMARLSAPDASCATFTAAGFVRRGLAAQGFAMRKVPGFAHKREMLVGRRAGPAAAAPHRPRTARVVGAGMAGATAARLLAERGLDVTVLEVGRVAGGASGNAAAALYPQLTKQYQPATAWHLLAYAHTLRALARWQGQGLAFGWQQPGMLRLPRDGDPQALLAGLQLDTEIARYVTQQEAAAIAGCAVARDGIFLPQGGALDPGALCRALLEHPRVTLREGCAAGRPDGEADITVLAAGWQSGAWHAGMAFGRSAGQVSMLEGDAPPRAIVSHRGYAIGLAGRMLAGATYDREDMSGAVTAANHAENMQHAQAALPGWKGAAVEGRTSTRATTPDRLPYVGRLAEGLYVSAGHGSRGMISAPLAASVIVAQALGEPVPLAPELRAAIDPLRRAGGSR